MLQKPTIPIGGLYERIPYVSLKNVMAKGQDVTENAFFKEGAEKESFFYLSSVLNDFFIKLNVCLPLLKHEGVGPFKLHIENYINEVQQQINPSFRNVFLEKAVYYMPLFLHGHMSLCHKTTFNITPPPEELFSEGVLMKGGPLQTEEEALFFAILKHIETLLCQIGCVEMEDLTVISLTETPQTALLKEYNALLGFGVMLGFLTQEESSAYQKNIQEKTVYTIAVDALGQSAIPTLFALQIASGETPFAEVNALGARLRMYILSQVLEENKKSVKKGSHA